MNPLVGWFSIARNNFEYTPEEHIYHSLPRYIRVDERLMEIFEQDNLRTYEYE